MSVVLLAGCSLYYKANRQSTNSQPKIFQIGFNRCDTNTLYTFFAANGIKSIHYDKGNLALSMHNNYKTGNKLLDQNYNHYQAFFDMENIYTEQPIYIALEHFKTLDKQYPGSKFILNTRSKEAWLRSRARQQLHSAQMSYLEYIAQSSNTSKLAVLERWEAEWDKHHSEVIEYFKDRPSDLLIFNIDNDTADKLVNFFQTHFKLDASLYKHVDINASRKLPLKEVRVFQIGFNKCGTTTISDFFNANGIASVHYDDGKVAQDIWNNYNSNQPLISQKYDKYKAFFDMQNIHHTPPLFIAQTLFKEFDKQYPGSKFILNLRDKNAWLKSRSNHKTMYGISYLELAALRHNLSKEEVIENWSKEWDMHNAAVLEYFKDRPNDLLVFNIETDSADKLRNFFIENYILDVTKYTIKNKTIISKK